MINRGIGQMYKKYDEIRDDIAMLLCRMGEIADENSQKEEYDSLFFELCKNLHLIDKLHLQKYTI